MLVSIWVLAVSASFSAAQDPLDRYRYAVGLAERGLHEKAVEECSAFLRENPDHEKAPQVRYRMGQSLFELKRWEEAAKGFEALLGNRFEFEAEAAFRRGQCLLELGRPAEAAPLFEGIARGSPEHYLAEAATHFGAEADFRRGEFARAEGGFGRLLEKWPRSQYRKPALHGLAWSRFRGGLFETAAQALGLFLREFAEDPLAPEAAYLLGESLLKIGRSAEAAEAFGRVVSGEFADDAAVARAAALEKAGDEKRATEAYLAAAERYPASPLAADARVGAGAALLRGEKWAEAVRVLEAVKEGPRRAEAIALLALALVRSGRAEDALARLEALLRDPKIDPEVARRARLARAEALGAVGRHGEAAREYEAAGSAGTEPDFAPAAAVLARLKGGDAKGAAEAAREFLARFRESPRVNEIRLALAESLFAQGLHAEAAREFEPLARGKGDPAASAASRLAWCLYLTGKKGEAAAAFADVSARFPGHARATEARVLEGRARLESGDPKGAARAFRAANEKGAGELADEALLGLARACAASGDPAGAKAQFEQFERSFPRSERRPQALYEFAELLAKEGDREGARARYASLLRDEPRHELAPFARYGLAWCALDGGDAAAAARLAREILGAGAPASLEAPALDLLATATTRAGGWEEALGTYRALLGRAEASGARPSILLGEASALARLGRNEEARRKLDALVAESSAREVADRALYELGFVRKACGDAAGAEEAFATVEREHGKSAVAAEVPFHRGELAYEAGRFAEAEGHYARAKAPAVLERSLYKIGWSRLKQGKNAPAASSFEEAASKGGALAAESLFLSGEALFRDGRFEEARERLRNFRTRHPDHELLPKALFRLGLACGELGRFEEALEALEDLARRAPRFENRAEADLWIARALRRTGRAGQARKVLERVAATGGDLLAARARLETGEILLGEGNADGALSEFLKVAILYDHAEEAARALLGAADCLEKTGQRDRARERCRELIERFPDHPLAAQARSRIERP
ncbi:MAG TPA: tetratricopeptide repeat protein [Planctomycetota bacterium]|nr:tetratricopeptide repeat protein [Planctomycetota bacterium]